MWSAISSRQNRFTLFRTGEKLVLKNASHASHTTRANINCCMIFCSSVVLAKTRNCVCVWDIGRKADIKQQIFINQQNKEQQFSYKLFTLSCLDFPSETGKILRKICESSLGAIVTQAAVTRNGRVLITCESSCLLVWNLETAVLVHKEFLPEVVQLLLWHDDRRLFVLTEVQK